jgi:hypothetical protein
MVKYRLEWLPFQGSAGKLNGTPTQGSASTFAILATADKALHPGPSA